MATRPSGKGAGESLRCMHAILFVCILLLASPSGARSQTPDTTHRAQSRDSGRAAAASGTQAPAATAPPAGPTAPTAASAGSTTSPADSSQAQLQFIGLKAAPNGVHGVVSGGSLMLQLNRAPRTDTPVVALISTEAPPDSQPVRLGIDAISGTNIFVRIPSKTRNGRYRVLVYSDTDPRHSLAHTPQEVIVKDLYGLIALALIPVLVMVLIIWLVVRRYRPLPNQPKRNWLQLLLIDPSNNTYSLSRAQFIWWTGILVFSYGFLFISRALVEHIYEFPSLDGFAWTFLISLGTLLGAQATEQVKGAKGSGTGAPVLADLFMHGGVIALERVQQVLWTLVGSVMFVVILLKNYSISTMMPVIPQELLAVMGLSSAGYIGGKVIRNPGPTISNAVPNGDGTYSITGQNLAPNAKVLIDGVEAGTVNTVKVDPTKSGNNATELKAVASAVATKSMTGPKQVVVVNPDGQRATTTLPGSLVQTVMATQATVPARGQAVTTDAGQAVAADPVPPTATEGASGGGTDSGAPAPPPEAG
ncbi:MAG TPA: hypothetical protein VHI13_13480 [Candidatus Kapabacteria bacterium]|nr:hypothetical protein [Candidatus Kapabacteria bacterium]